ncbi:MAG: iron-containing alcohol dehydrogenase [Spirochaetia bacterium]|jgi:alcohol dehydrogenase class IV
MDEKKGNYRQFMPVTIHFGAGALGELGGIVRKYGKKVLLVTEPWVGWNEKLLHECKAILEKEGLEVTVFDGVIPNPTTAAVAEAARAGKGAGCQVVVGVGGGSTMDTAKAAAIEMTHPLPCFEYAYFQPQQPTAATLPIVLVTTTSGTGSHVSKCSVVTHSEKGIKTGIVSDFIFAREAIVDPTLMLSMPADVTAATGFDVFTHAFESYININANPYIDAHAIESIRTVADALPRAVREGSDRDARVRMTIADTLAGTCIANVGTTLPHSLGQPVSGHFPRVSHGGALAMIYPAFMEFSWKGSIAKFARVARIFNPRLHRASDEKAARQSASVVKAFLQRIGLTDTLRSVPGVEAKLDVLVKEAMDFPDTFVNPVVPTADQARQLFLSSM